MAANQPAASPLWGVSDEGNAALVAELIGGADTVLTGQLPDLITTYQVEQGKPILGPKAYENMVNGCMGHPDYPLGPEDLARFLDIFANAEPESPESPDIPETTTTSVPATPSKHARRHSRRVSDRIKSPSDSSDASDEDLKTDEDRAMSSSVRDVGFQRAQSEDIHVQRKTSVTLMSPTGSSGGGVRQPFPGGGAFGLASTPEIAVSRRTKTLSESSLRYGDDSPLAARPRTTDLAGISYPGIPLQRPLSNHHRRRLSRDISGHSADDMSSNDVPAAKFTRSASTSSIPSSRGRSESPASPMVDNTSFHSGFQSPPRELLADDSYLNGDRSEEPDLFDLNDNRLLAADLRPAARIGKISTTSTSSLTSQHDQVQELKRQIADLERRRKDAERAVEAMGQDNDQLLADMQDRLDEALNELAMRKKEQAEYKGKDRAHAMVVKNLEGEVEILKRQLNETRTGHAEALKRHQASIDNSSKLSEALREREVETETLAQQNENCENEILRLQAQIEAFEAQLDRQRREFEDGEMAKTELVKQKEINLELQAENELLKRHHVPQALSPDIAGRLGVPGGSAGPSTFSRNLGAEFARHIDDDEDDQSMVEETETVTTRVVRRHSRMNSRAFSDPASLFDGHDEEIVEENTREYVEVGTDPDPELSAPPPSPCPPAYEPPVMSPEEIISHAHPRREPSSGSAPDEDEDDYKNLVRNIGIRCKLYEEELERKRQSGEKTTSSRLRRKRSQTYSGSSADERGEGWKWDATTLGAAGCIFAVGVMVGGMWLSGASPSQREIDMFTRVHTIAMAAGGYGEGFFPPGMMRNALDQGARRLFVPV